MILTLIQQLKDLSRLKHNTIFMSDVLTNYTF